MSQSSGKIILAVGAHPDDVDFGCSGTLAKFALEGADVYITVSTSGNRGSRDHEIDQKKLVEERRKEQLDAAKIIGAKEVIFLDHEDGNLIPDINFKEELVKIIRKYKPDIVITHDPAWYYSIREDYAFVNHNDHRATGVAMLDAVYPLARDLSSFPEHKQEGLTPHKVSEVYLFSFDNPSYFIDISKTLDKKIAAMLAHKSQVDNPKELEKRFRERAEELGKKGGYKFAEGFIRLVLR